MDNKPIIFIDSGDTLIDESTQVYDNNGIVQSAEFIQGAEQFLRNLKTDKYIVALVADGDYMSFKNVYQNYGLWDFFDKKIISSKVGNLKPHEDMFKTAMEKLNLNENDKKNIIMVGNNLRRDIKGANAFGITSVWINWSPRYYTIPREENEKPDYTVGNIEELNNLIHMLSHK